MKTLRPEDKYLLDSFCTSPKRRNILQSMLAMGIGGATLTQFANVLAASSDEEVAKLVILSQPGILPKLCAEISNHRSENPLGGKRRVWPLLNAAGITTAMGNTRKSSIAPT